MNVYGASLPGLPLVMVGFNEYIAWGATNAMTDVIDWYEIEFKDGTRSAYLYDSTWLPTRKRIEEIKVRGKNKVIDTVVYTHHGPVIYGPTEKPYDIRVPKGTAMRWIGHDQTNGFDVFLQWNRARNYDDFQKAVIQYDYPGLNLAFAGSDGDIAMWHAGKFPLRWTAMGRYISDGRNPSYDWHEYIPMEQLPHIANPDRGFVSSANQYPVDERYPYYLGGSFWSFDRGARINERLSTMHSITKDSMIALQNDVVDVMARMILPFLLAGLDRQKLFIQERRNYDELAYWNYEFKIDLIAPTIFTYWWREISEMIWSDEMKKAGHDFPTPRTDVTIWMMLNKPNSKYFDTNGPAAREKLKDIIVKAFHSASNKLFEELGTYGENWRWGRASKFNIEHLAQIPGMGNMNLTKPGSEFTINVKHHIPLGRSWRMVVTLGNEPKGWGIYPGGQSGNPGSRFYDNFVSDWLSDAVYEFLFLRTPEANAERIIGRTLLRSSR
jgi:penicillin amidase